jgi:hypothetical protein
MENEDGTPPVQGYDLIGDIHGHAEPLHRLLRLLGYRQEDASYRHDEGRKVVFLGDFIDRGPEIRETLHLVKGMIDGGNALAVMGNHEFNAVCFHTPDGQGDYLRSRTAGGGMNVKQHQATLEAFDGLGEEWNMWLYWFKELPFYLELEGLRAVHATWKDDDIEFLCNHSLHDPEFLSAAVTKKTRAFSAIEKILKGIEIRLPNRYFFTDKQDLKRKNIRVRWWEPASGKTYRQVVFPDCATVPNAPIDSHGPEAWSGYDPTEPPVFFGHYWLPPTLQAQPVGPNVACLDYSVAKPGGKLVAYRWDGEALLESNRFVEVSTEALASV